MEEHTTEFLIHHEDKAKITGYSPPVEFVGKGLYMRRSRSIPVSYYDMHDLERTKNLQVSEIFDSGQTKKIDLPPNVVKRIALFFRLEKDIIKGFDCHSFVHFIHNIPYTLGELDMKKWKTAQTDGKTIHTGDAVFLSSSDTLSNIVHSAIYLGENRYLSKFGVTGKLVVTDLENMKKGWDGKTLFHARPVKNET